MNRAGDIATTGTVLFNDWGTIRHPGARRDPYIARVILVRYEVDYSAPQRADTAWVPSVYILRLLLHMDCDGDPIRDSQVVLDDVYNDARAIRTAIVRYHELLTNAPRLISEWRTSRGLDMPEDMRQVETIAKDEPASGASAQPIGQ